MGTFSILSLGLFIGFMSGCLHSADRLDQELATWVGRAPDDLVEAWGAPRSSYVMDKGQKVLSYESTETINRFSGYFHRPDFYSYTDTCKINFYTDSTQKTIARTSYLGNPNGCLDMLHATSNSPH